MISLTYEGTEILDDVVIADARFESRSDGGSGQCVFRVRDREHGYTPGYFKTGGELILSMDGLTLWGGYVMSVGRAYAFDVDITTDPIDTPRFWVIQGTDWNILFQKRIVHDKTNPLNPVPTYPGSTNDSDVVLDLVDDYLDLEDDGLSMAGVTTVGPISPFGEEFWPGDPGEMWGQVMSRIIASNGAIFYIDPDKTLQYRDAEVPSSPFDLSDDPDAVSTFGFREMTIFSAATEMANDALVWGAGRGSDQVVFARSTDAASVAEHGLFQWADFRSDMWVQDTVQRRADSYVYGSPTSRRGHKDERDTVQATLFKPGLRVGQVVDVTSEVFDYQNDLPIRSCIITFPTPTDPKFVLELSERYDTPFFFADPWPPYGPGPGFPFDPWVTEDANPPSNEANILGSLQGQLSVSREFPDADDWAILWEPRTSDDLEDLQLLRVQYGHLLFGEPNQTGGNWSMYWVYVNLDRPSVNGLLFTFGPHASIDVVGSAYDYDIEANFASGPGRTYEVSWLPQGIALTPIEDAWGTSPTPSDPPPPPLDHIPLDESWRGTVFYREDVPEANEGPRQIYVPPQYTAAGANWYILTHSNTTFEGMFHRRQLGESVVHLGTMASISTAPVIPTPLAVWTHGDGYQTQYPYVPGTLSVSIEGVNLIRGVDFIETDPLTGTFTLTGEFQDWSGSIYVTYRRADVTATAYNPDPALGPGSPEPGDPYVDAGGVPGGRFYRPAGQRQLGWGTIYDGVNCNMASSAMALDRHTLGAHSATRGYPISTPPTHRYYSGVTERRGTNQPEAVKAWNDGWGATLIWPGPVRWSYFVSQIQSGRGAVCAGRYYAMAEPYKKQDDFNGPHAIYINEQLEDGSFWGYDPLYRYPIIYPYSVLQNYMAAFYGNSYVSALFTRVTPRL